MASKIKNIIETSPKGGVLLSSWLSRKGLTRTEQVSYVKSGWLERIFRGVYTIKGVHLQLYPTLNALNIQSDLVYHIGATTALELKGFAHYGQLGKQKVFLYTDIKFPRWIVNRDWDMNIIYHYNNKYENLGLTEIEYEGVNIKVSTPERAFFECIDLLPIHTNPMDLYYIMEMLSTLRPRLIMGLMEKASIKTRRVFLYLADKAHHPWFDDLNLKDIELGSGDRSVSHGGSYDSKYRIVIPKELANYE